MKVSKSKLVVVVALASLAGACLQPLEVGSNGEPITHQAGPSSDGGLDAGLPCGTCEPEDAGLPVCSGEVTIRDFAQWEEFLQRRCVRFSGSLKLQLDLPQPSSVELRNDTLEGISGNLFLQSNSDKVSFSNLTVLGGALDIALNGVLREVSFPALRSSGPLNIVGNGALSAIEFPLLEEVKGHLDVQYNDSLASLSLPALTAVGGSHLTVFRNPALESVNLPLLARAGLLGFSVFENPVLTRLSLPALTFAESMSISANAVLESVGAPVLATATTLRVLANPSLIEVRFPALTAVSEFQVYDNDRLRQCLVDALGAQLDSPPATYLATGNGGLPNTCP